MENIKGFYVSINNLMELNLENYISNISKNGKFVCDIEINK